MQQYFYDHINESTRKQSQEEMYEPTFMKMWTGHAHKLEQKGEIQIGIIVSF